MENDFALPWEPDWLRNLMIYQLRIDEFSPDGTIATMPERIAYLKELGVNAVWLTPIYEANRDPVQGNCAARFCNFDVKEPHLLEPEYGSMNEFSEMISLFHAAGIKVLLETVPHGVTFNSSLVTSHPDWFKHSADGSIHGSWGMADFNWENQMFCQYWIKTMTRWVLESGVDGFRCDLEPHITGYRVWGEVVRKCRDAGREIAVFSELNNARRACYHFEQVGVGDIHPTQGSGDYFLENNIVDSIKNGTGISCDGKAPYITFAMSVHDSFCYHSRLSRLRFGYEMLFAPVIPLWFGGEEFGADTTKNQLNRGVLFFNKIHWSLLQKKQNHEFLSEVKKLISLRNSDLTVFAPDGRPVSQSNLVKVDSNMPLQAYARTAKDYAYIVAGMPGKADPSWQYQSGDWQVEYGSLSQRREVQTESVATIAKPFVGLKEISFSMTTKICPDKEMGGLGGVLIGGGDPHHEEPGVNKGYFIGFCGNQRTFVTYNGKLIVDKMTSPSPQQEISVRIVFANGKGRIIMEGNQSEIQFPLTGKTDGYFSFITSRAHVHFNDLKIKAGSTFKDNFKGTPVKYIITPDFESLGMKKRGVYRITNLLDNTSYDRVVQNGLLQIKGKVKGNDLLLFKLEQVK